MAAHALQQGAPTITGCHCYVAQEEIRSPDLAVLAATAVIPRGLAYALLPHVGLQLACALHPETGALAQLGLGTKQVSLHSLRSLKRWRLMLSFASVPGTLAVLLFPLLFTSFLISSVKTIDRPPGLDLDEDNKEDPSGALNAFESISFLLGWFGSLWWLSLSMVWLLSLKIAAVLADDDVVEIIKAAADHSRITDDKDCKESISKPSRGLAKTMALLSSGWGQGVAIVTLSMWCWAFSRAAEFLLEVHKLNLGLGTGEYTIATAFQRKLGPGAVYTIIPFFVVADLATVSSLCDKLVNLLNDFGLDPELEADRALEVHNKVFPLLSSLRGLHGSQGLGFVSMGTVIDRKTLNRAFVAIVSVSSVVIPIIVALQPESVLVDQAGGSS